MSIFKKLAAQGAIKAAPRKTATNCETCKTPLKDFEALRGNICTKCEVLKTIAAKPDGTCLSGAMGYKLHEDGINNANVSNDLPF